MLGTCHEYESDPIKVGIVVDLTFCEVLKKKLNKSRLMTNDFIEVGFIMIYSSILLTFSQGTSELESTE